MYNNCKYLSNVNIYTLRCVYYICTDACAYILIQVYICKHLYIYNIIYRHLIYNMCTYLEKIVCVHVCPDTCIICTCIHVYIETLLLKKFWIKFYSNIGQHLLLMSQIWYDTSTLFIRTDMESIISGIAVVAGFLECPKCL